MLRPPPRPNNRNDLGLGTRLKGNGKEREMKKKGGKSGGRREWMKKQQRELERQGGAKTSLINQDEE